MNLGQTLVQVQQHSWYCLWIIFCRHEFEVNVLELHKLYITVWDSKGPHTPNKCPFTCYINVDLGQNKILMVSDIVLSYSMQFNHITSLFLFKCKWGNVSIMLTFSKSVQVCEFVWSKSCYCSVADHCQVLKNAWECSIINEMLWWKVPQRSERNEEQVRRQTEHVTIGVGWRERESLCDMLERSSTQFISVQDRASLLQATCCMYVCLVVSGDNSPLSYCALTHTLRKHRKHPD